MTQYAHIVYDTCWYSTQGQTYCKLPVLNAADWRQVTPLFETFDVVTFNSDGEALALAKVDTPVGSYEANYFVREKDLLIRPLNSPEVPPIFSGYIEPRAFTGRESLKKIVLDALHKKIAAEQGFETV